jgi:hypothetical protein
MIKPEDTGDRREPSQDPHREYLGDGLYAETNGYQIILKANSYISPTDTIYLDELVAQALVKYIRARSVEE